MSVDVSVHAQRRLNATDYALVDAFNALIAVGENPPAVLAERINKNLGYQAAYICPGGDADPIDLSRCPADGTAVIEIEVSGKGDVMYHDGMVIQIADLPAGTFALRIDAG